LAHEKTVQEFDNALGLINEVQDGLSKMKDAENYLKVEASQGKELTPTTREQITSDMTMIAETLKKNKEELAKLKANVSNSKTQSTQLKATIERLMAELDAKSKLVADLQAQLADKDVKIGELVAKSESLSGEINTLSQETQKQRDELAAQDKSLNTAWYVFGSKAELKKQKVITGGGLFKSADVLKKDFNKEYFTKIDASQVTSISIGAKKAKIVTNHPSNSYKLVGEKTIEKIEILDAEEIFQFQFKIGSKWITDKEDYVYTIHSLFEDLKINYRTLEYASN
jgi:uncharacterized phage infection (PIP) family protein YhgE